MSILENTLVYAQYDPSSEAAVPALAILAHLNAFFFTVRRHHNVILLQKTYRQCKFSDRDGR